MVVTFDKLLMVALVLAGICQLSASLCNTRRIILELPRSGLSWRVLTGLIIAFIVGYIAFILLMLEQPSSSLMLVVALVFAGGGGFVLTVTYLSAKTIWEVKRVTHLQQENERISTMRKRLQAILDNTAEGIITFTPEGIIEAFNQAAEKLFGYAESEVIGQDIGLLVLPDNVEQRDHYLEHFLQAETKRLIGREGELIGRHVNGDTFPMAIKISSLCLEGRCLFTALVSNISERKAMLQRLQQMAEHDSLSGLHNRAYFQHYLEQSAQRARQQGERLALLYIDLDNFKYVNDTLGHAAGDRLIINVAQVLLKSVRRSDFVARLGGDEFTVLLFDTGVEDAVKVAETFRGRFGEFVFRDQGIQVDVGCSIGVAAFTEDTDGADELLAQADFACHLAKRAGRNCVRVYRAEDQPNVNTISIDMGWSRRIKHMLEHDELLLATQPIVSIATGDVYAHEVLLRMRDERGELIMPRGFLPAAERFGLMRDLDNWVIDHAIERLASLRQRQPDLRFSINLSAPTLADGSIADLILRKLNLTGLDPTVLTLEVTEAAAIADMGVAERVLESLREMGCRIALDDFGSGMYSFAYLRELAVDLVKIDGRFVKNIAASAVDQSMVKAINEIVHALGKKTVAEWVEDDESLRLLTQMGVDYAQGYRIGRPLLLDPTVEAASSACA